MRGKLIKHRFIHFILAIVLLTSMAIPAPVKAAKKVYITRGEFIKLLIVAVGLDENMGPEEPYINAARKVGIVMPPDSTDYSKNMSQEDAAVLLNRADEYLHGTDTVEESLYNVVKEKRISDIKKIEDNKVYAAVNTMAKGILSGKSNGYYIQNRSFNPKKNILLSEAKSAVKRVVSVNKRYKLSPDGMLIRTTKLPKNADNFEYILACYPNEFYEKKFEYMFWSSYLKGTIKKEQYSYPVAMKNHTFKNALREWEFKDEYLYEWTQKADDYLNQIFNVDYRTVNTTWINELAAMYALPQYSTSDDGEPEHIKEYYIDLMKKNKVVVESDIVSVEPSTLYYYSGYYYMRAYVRFRITAKNINVDQDELIYNRYTSFDNLKNGVWRDCVFDIQFASRNGFSGDGSDTAINLRTALADYANVPIE